MSLKSTALAGGFLTTGATWETCGLEAVVQFGSVCGNCSQMSACEDSRGLSLLRAPCCCSFFFPFSFVFNFYLNEKD